MAPPFVPGDFTVPTHFHGRGFRLEPLGPEHNARDHAAWMGSIDHIHATPGFEDSAWPHPMGLDENLTDLEGHARDFAGRVGFTYSILDGDEVIGCLYVYPARSDGADAEIRSWVTGERSDMDAIVREDVSAWVARRWPFRRPRYAGSAP